MKQNDLPSKTNPCSILIHLNFFRRKNPEKRSSTQRIFNLSPTQRLDNLIQSSTNDLASEGKKHLSKVCVKE
jgi:hypothetical protein